MNNMDGPPQAAARPSPAAGQVIGLTPPRVPTAVGAALIEQSVAGSSIRSPADGATAAKGAAGNVNVDATNNGAEIMQSIFDAPTDSDKEGKECDIVFCIFFSLLYLAAVASCILGVVMLCLRSDDSDYARSGNFFSSYRSGYICGTEPPTQEELVARSAVPMCLNLTINAENRTGYGDYVSNRPLCLQAGALDEPAVWCTELELRPIFLYWSPCNSNKCDGDGTAWRIFDEQDNDKSYFKRPTFPQPSSSTEPLEDGWLEWDWVYASWKNTTSISISECSSGDGGYSYSFGAVDDTYTIPPACYSDTIYMGTNPVAVAGLTLLVFGFCFSCSTIFLGDGDGEQIDPQQIDTLQTLVSNLPL